MRMIGLPSSVSNAESGTLSSKECTVEDRLPAFGVIEDENAFSSPILPKSSIAVSEALEAILFYEYLFLISKTKCNQH